MLDVTITAPADVQAEETDAWDLAQMWAEFRAELEIAGEQAEEVYRNLRRHRHCKAESAVADRENHLCRRQAKMCSRNT